jgi:hypothetical protein
MCALVSYVKKQSLNHNQTQSTPVQVVVDQQRVAVTLRNDTHPAITHNGCSTLADPMPVCVRVLEACCTAAPTTNFDASGCSPDKSVYDNSDYPTESFSDSNNQSHSSSVQAVNDAKAKELLSM